MEDQFNHIVRPLLIRLLPNLRLLSVHGGSENQAQANRLLIAAAIRIEHSADLRKIRRRRNDGETRRRGDVRRQLGGRIHADAGDYVVQRRRVCRGCGRAECRLFSVSKRRR